MLKTVNAGEGFLSWILQFGVEAEVFYALELRETIIKRIEELGNLYKSINEQKRMNKLP